MPTSIDTNVHFLAKKAKCRLSGGNKNTPTECSKYEQRDKETYQMILRMLAEEQTVYDPIARVVGKDLASIPDSPEKTRISLETGKYINEIKKRIRCDLIKLARRNETIVIDGKEYDPFDLLRKLH